MFLDVGPRGSPVVNMFSIKNGGRSVEKREKALQNELAATKQKLVVCTENLELFKLEEYLKQ